MPAEKDFKYASFGQRLFARSIDGLLCFFFYLLIGVFVSLAMVIFLPKEAELNQKLQIEVQSQIEKDLQNQRNFSAILESATKAADIVNNCKVTNLTVDDCEKAKNFNSTQSFITILISTAFAIPYFVLLPLTSWRGTLGKKIAGIQIVDEHFEKISLLKSFTREIFWIMSGVTALIAIWLPIIGLLRLTLQLTIASSALRILFSEEKASLHDLIAKTRVISLK